MQSTAEILTERPKRKNKISELLKALQSEFAGEKVFESEQEIIDYVKSVRREIHAHNA